MDLLQALILGIVQGITEFLPISSSAHLKIFRKFLNIHEASETVIFDLCCHAGTTLALIFVLRKLLWQVLHSKEKIKLISLSIIPLVPAYFLLKPLRDAASDPKFLGFFLFATAILLFLAASFTKLDSSFSKRKKNLDVLWIGSAQAMALIPGISRSGSTIATARFLGWELKEAAEFSFLLSIPTILGGECLEMGKFLYKTNFSLPSLEFQSLAVGFFSAFFVGLITCRAIFWIYERQIIRPFAWYCLGAGCVALAIFHG